jgi:transposase
LPAGLQPDLNPIEKMFSKLKESLRSAAARTVDGVYEAMGEGLRAVTTQDIAGWFESCGYRYKQP